MLLIMKKTNAQRTDSAAQNALTKANHFVVVAIFQEKIAHTATRAHIPCRFGIHSTKCESSLCAQAFSLASTPMYQNNKMRENRVSGNLCICICRLGVRIYVYIYKFVCIVYEMGICNGNCGKRLLGFACDNNNLIQRSIPVGYPLSLS